MKEFCEETHSFVLRWWLEPREIEGAKPIWRGEVEHVPTGRRSYFKSFDELREFMVPYMPEISGA